VSRRKLYGRSALAALLLWLIPCGCAAREDVITRKLAPGITYTQEITPGTAPLLVNVLRVDLKAPGVKVRCGQSQDAITLNGPTKGREPLHSLAARSGAVAGVNADFFPFTGDPLGIAIRDGELLREPMDYRACLGICPGGVLMDVLVPVGTLTAANGSVNALDGINRLPQDGEVVALTPSYRATPKPGRTAAVVTLREVSLPVRVSQDVKGTVDSVATVGPNEALPACPPGGCLLVAAGRTADGLSALCAPGDSVRFRFDLASNGLPPERGRFPARAGTLRGRTFAPCWTDVEQAVGGGPWLVRNGQIAVDGEAENFPKEAFVEQRHGRTAAGVTADGRLLLVTVDGRQATSVGASLNEMAQILKRLGAVNAINLDGGGSTTMIVGNGVVNAPSDGRERAIADSLLVYGGIPEVPNAETLQIRPFSSDGVTARAGQPLAFSVVDADEKPLRPDAPVFWGTEDGFGFVSQRGVFMAYHVGTGKVVARIGSRLLAVPITVTSAEPAALKAVFSAVANNPPDRSLLMVTLRDKFGNPVPDQRVTVAIQGGEVEASLTTDANGQASSEVVWEADAAQRVLTISAGGAPPVTLRR
jgi:hypothetical protein